MLVPIGGWCRTAFQVNEFLETKSIRPIAYPFDWTITPFSALKKVMDENFVIEKSLESKNLNFSKFGSILDEHTQLIHHHDLSSVVVNRFLKTDETQRVNNYGVPLQLFDTDLITKVKGRLLYVYRNLELLKSQSNKIGFIRWMRGGHPDSGLPSAFEGESITTLAILIRGFLGHDNFSILQVTSHLTNDNLDGNDIVSSYSREKRGVSATILERKGFNGDGTENFRGDTKSWSYLLSKYIDEEGITF